MDDLDEYGDTGLLNADDTELNFLYPDWKAKVWDTGLYDSVLKSVDFHDAPEKRRRKMPQDRRNRAVANMQDGLENEHWSPREIGDIQQSSGLKRKRTEKEVKTETIQHADSGCFSTASNSFDSVIDWHEDDGVADHQTRVIWNCESGDEQSGDEIEELKRENHDLKERMTALEATVASMTGQFDVMRAEKAKAKDQTEIEKMKEFVRNEIATQVQKFKDELDQSQTESHELQQQKLDEFKDQLEKKLVLKLQSMVSEHGRRCGSDFNEVKCSLKVTQTNVKGMQLAQNQDKARVDRRLDQQTLRLEIHERKHEEAAAHTRSIATQVTELQDSQDAQVQINADFQGSLDDTKNELTEYVGKVRAMKSDLEESGALPRYEDVQEPDEGDTDDSDEEYVIAVRTEADEADVQQ